MAVQGCIKGHREGEGNGRVITTAREPVTSRTPSLQTPRSSQEKNGIHYQKKEGRRKETSRIRKRKKTLLVYKVWEDQPRMPWGRGNGKAAEGKGGSVYYVERDR